jgi:hypothetical protein
MYAIETRVDSNLQIVVTLGTRTRTYATVANRYGSVQDTHAHAAMQFIRDEGLRVDYPIWHGARIGAGYVFVYAGSHMNEYAWDFAIKE